MRISKLILYKILSADILTKKDKKMVEGWFRKDKINHKGITIVNAKALWIKYYMKYIKEDFKSYVKDNRNDYFGVKVKILGDMIR